jgi:hypothetical protein
MTERDVSNDPADYLAGLCILVALGVMVLMPAAWFIATGHWFAFFLTIFFGKFAAWIVTAPLIDDEED